MKYSDCEYDNRGSRDGEFILLALLADCRNIKRAVPLEITSRSCIIENDPETIDQDMKPYKGGISEGKPAQSKEIMMPIAVKNSKRVSAILCIT